jgi:hypothetical protein
VFSLIGMATQAGDVDHLAATFLLCHSISHGINLRKSPVLQYLYYLGQVILPVLGVNFWLHFSNIVNLHILIFN